MKAVNEFAKQVKGWIYHDIIVRFPESDVFRTTQKCCSVLHGHCVDIAENITFWISVLRGKLWNSKIILMQKTQRFEM